MAWRRRGAEEELVQSLGEGTEAGVVGRGRCVGNYREGCWSIWSICTIAMQRGVSVSLLRRDCSPRGRCCSQSASRLELSPSTPLHARGGQGGLRLRFAKQLPHSPPPT